MQKLLRDIIDINEELCNGCGRCVLDCAEGAIALVNGKAKVISETYCDGLGACLSGCPQNALTIVKRESLAFDEDAVKEHLARREARAGEKAAKPQPQAKPQPEAKEYPSSGKPKPAGMPGFGLEKMVPFGGSRPSPLQMMGTAAHPWPVKLRLVPPVAPFLQEADILLTADCAPAASPRFHDLVKGRIPLLVCPKFEDKTAIREKLQAIMTTAKIRTLTVLRMEVPCCRGALEICEQLCRQENIPMHEYVMARSGDIAVLR